MFKLFILILLFFSLSAQAFEISPLVGANLTFGGDSLAYVVFTDGSRSDLEAGRGVSFFGGASFDSLWQKDDHHLDFQATIGFKFASTKAATNGELTFTRWPIEALLFYRNPNLSIRAGLGVSYHLANKVSGTEDASGITATARNALGYVSQVDYLFGQRAHLAVGIRFEKVSYEIRSQSLTASGDNLGIQFSYFWKSDQ